MLQVNISVFLPSVVVHCPRAYRQVCKRSRQKGTAPAHLTWAARRRWSWNLHPWNHSQDQRSLNQTEGQSLCTCPGDKIQILIRAFGQGHWQDINLVHFFNGKDKLTGLNDSATRSCYSTHIMKKTPPQSAVQERLVGSTLEFRPIGPSRRPSTLHTTTRRTTQHTPKAPFHLGTHGHTLL